MYWHPRLIFLAAVWQVAFASPSLHFVSGIGRSNFDPPQDIQVQFSLDVFSSTVESVVASTHNGPNRTNAVAFPVVKLHGVNVNN